MSSSNRRPGIPLRTDQRPSLCPEDQRSWRGRNHGWWLPLQGRGFSTYSSQNQFSEYWLAFLSLFQNERERRRREGREGERKARWSEKGRRGDRRGESELRKEKLYFGNFSVSICGLCFKKMQITHLEGPSSPISWHLIRMQLSPIPYIQTIISDPSILGHE